MSKNSRQVSTIWCPYLAKPLKWSLSLPQLYGVATPKRLEIGLPVIIDYVIVSKTFLNPKEHQKPISGSKVTPILLKGWILPIGGVASGRVCTCCLRSRLVFSSKFCDVLDLIFYGLQLSWLIISSYICEFLEEYLV